MTAPHPTLSALDFTPPCDGCEKPAHLAHTTRCCRMVWIACLRCRDLARTRIDREPESRCLGCKALILSWSHFIAMEVRVK